MSLTIRISTQTPIIDSGMALGFSLPGIGSEFWPNVVQFNDALLSGFSATSWFADFGPRRLTDVFGFHGSYGDNLLEYVLSEPVTVRSYDGIGYDSRFYGSFYRNLQLFGSVLSGASIAPPSSEGERLCSHSTYLGESMFEQPRITFLTATLTLLGMSAECRHSSEFRKRVTVSNLDPLQCTSEPDDTVGAELYDIIPVFNALIRAGSIDVPAITHGALNLVTYSDFDLALNSSSFKFSWHTRVRYAGGGTFEWNAHLGCAFFGQPSSPAVIGQRSTPEYSASFDVGFSEASWGGTDGFPYDGNHGTNIPSGVSTSGSMFGNGSSFPITSTIVDLYSYVVKDPDPVLRPLARGLRRTFDDVISAYWYDITASSVFSTVDAFLASEGSLGVNILQNLQKLPGIVDALPDIRAAVDVLGRICRRDLSFATLREILDLATSTVLKGNFEWRPYYQVITQYIPQMLSTLDSLGHTSERVEARGSFRYILPREIVGRDIALVTHTKMVMNSSASGLLSSVLGYDALGLLPKASNIWDLIPFSFMVNWFTGVGSALRRAEYSALLATIPAYYVHSYKLTSELTAKELATLGVASQSRSTPAFCRYVRDVSYFTPAPRDTRLGFGIPTKIPNIGVLGSLLYQLIFG